MPEIPGLPPLPPRPNLKPMAQPTAINLGANLKPVQHNTKHITLAPTIVLDPQEINGKSIALLGSTGSGKSTSARRFMEEHIRLGLGFTVCDIENEYHFLKTLGEVILAGPPISMDNAAKKIDDFSMQSLNHFDSMKLDIKLSNSNEFYEMGRKAYLKKMNVVLLLAGIEDDVRKVYLKAYLQGVFEAATQETKHYHRIFIEEAHEYCLSEDTEILTKDGFKKYTDIKEGDITVAFNLEKQEYQYETINKVIVKHFNGDMIRLKTDGGIDSLTTPDHRLVIQRFQHNPKRYKIYDPDFCIARDAPQQFAVPLGGSPCGDGLNIEDDILRIIGWVATDGNIHDRNTPYNKAICITQSEATVKLGINMRDELRILMQRTGAKSENIVSPGFSKFIEYDEDGIPNNLMISEKSESSSFYLGTELSQRVFEWTGENIHRVPRDIIEKCDRNQLSILFETLLYGDGSSKDGKSWSNFYPGHCEGLADDFQEIALKLGISTYKKLVDFRTGYKPQWVVFIANQRSKHWIRKINKSTEPYSGKVWCIQLNSGAFVARRNGKVFVTGNCPQGAGIAKDDPLMKMIVQIAKRGRKREISLCVMSQRPASLVKDVLTQCQLYLLHYVTYPNDIEIYDKICGLNNVQEIVRNMKSGDCVFINGRTQLQDRIFEPKTESTWTINDVNINHFKTIESLNLEEFQKEIVDEQSESGTSVVPTKYLREMEKLIPSLNKKLASMTEDAQLLQNRIFELSIQTNEINGGNNYKAQATIDHIKRLQAELDEAREFVEPMQLLEKILKKKIKADIRSEFNQKLKEKET